MTVQGMHYNFKMKLNKLDSEQNRNLLIPEIDVLLNEAMGIFINQIAEPRNKKEFGFETSQRNIDDLRTIVVRPESNPIAKININNNNIAKLPENYLYFIKAQVNMYKNPCGSRIGNFYLQRHNDNFEDNEFSKSSFEWNHVNGVIFDQGIKLFDDGTFTNQQLLLTYIRKPKYIHYAKGFNINGYKTADDNRLLVGTQDCELPEQTHSDIVDIAVYLAINNIMSDVQSKIQKLNFKDFK